ncbi:DUF5916 domain-containing protein [Candidatus Neomarinimicrobiota bacterium]
MYRPILALATIGILIAGENPFNPENYREREIVAIRLEKPLRIDGLLSEDLYQTAPNQTFIQREPDNGRLATENTEVWIAYDNEALYVGARLRDSQPDSIVARMGRRDAPVQSDEFQVLLDSYHDRRSGFWFFLTPSGTIQDGTAANDSRFDDTWDGIWEGKASIDPQGWTAEMRIPFSQLRFNEQDEYIWGIQLGRMIKRKNEHSLFTYIARGESGMVSRSAVLRGIRDVAPPRRREFTPYITGNYSNLPSEQDNPFYEGRETKLNLGTDLKLGIGSNITIDATINPDFGQVEVDPSVLNLSAYETYYEEKRPFFIEGADIFSFGRGGPTNRWDFNYMEPDFFYSRRIGRAPRGEIDTDGWVKIPSTSAILGAAKISGKLNGDWSIGGISALTNREYGDVSEDGQEREEEIEPLTSYNLIRTLKEFNEGRQGLGLITTYTTHSFDDPALRDILSDDALAIGVDGWTFIGDEKEWALGGWGGYTRVTGNKTRMLDLQQNSSHYFQRPDAEHVQVDTNMTTMTGYASRIVLNREQGHLLLNAALGITSPGFEGNDLGLHYGTDRINKHLAMGYHWYDPGRIFRDALLATVYMSNHNFSGTKINEMIFGVGFGQFLNYWSIETIAAWGPETMDDTKLRGGPMVSSPSGSFLETHINSDNRKDIVFGLGYNASRQAGGNNSMGFNGRVEVKLGTRLNLQFEPAYRLNNTVDQYIDTFEDENAVAMGGQRYVFAEIDQKTISAELRFDYTFTPTLSLQAYFQPFISAGKYSRFKEFTRPGSYDFMVYGAEGGPAMIREDEEEEGYYLNPTGGDESDAFFVEYPDFNYKALVGTAVLRWEYSPGSTLYLVWTRNGTNEDHPGNLQLNRDLGDLLGATPDNFFAIKATYWFGR